MLASTVYRTSPSFGCANVRDLDWSVGGLGDGWGEWMGGVDGGGSFSTSNSEKAVSRG